MIAEHDDPPTWSDLVAHEPGRRLTSAEPFADHLVVHEWKAAQPRVRVLRRDGSGEVLDFGDEPHDVAIGDNPEWSTSTVRLSYQSLTTPQSVYDHDLATGRRSLRKQTPTPGVDLDAYVSERSWASAADGVAIPVDVVRHRDTALDGTAACVVYGYGAYEHSLAPWFSVARLSLLDRGVVFALVHSAAAGSSAGRGISTASCSTSATRSPTRLPPATTSWLPASPTVPASPSAEGAPAASSSGPASRCARSASLRPSPRCPSSMCSPR